MTAMPRDLARKRSAEVVRKRPEVIEGRVVRKLGVGRVVSWFLLALTAVAFAGFLLSMTQQYA